jgi:hypothetical protein
MLDFPVDTLEAGPAPPIAQEVAEGVAGTRRHRGFHRLPRLAVVASHVEMLSGRKKGDYEAQQSADALVSQAEKYGDAPPTEPIPESAEAISPNDPADDNEEDDTEAAA